MKLLMVANVSLSSLLLITGKTTPPGGHMTDHVTFFP